MDPSRGDSRYNLNYSTMSSIGLSLSDPADMYGNPAAVAALGSGRPPSGGLIQSMGGGGGVSGGIGLGGRSSGLMQPSVSAAQCHTALTNTNSNSVGGGSQHHRGIKRAGSDCYEDHHRGGMSNLQGLDSCSTNASGGGNGQHQQQQQQAQAANEVDDGYSALPNKKSPPANGKKTKGRVKIKMEYIDNKLRRYTTFSKRKTGIMKKAYELSTLTGTQVMLLVASETGHVYTFATRKLQPMITSEAGKQLIQTCLNSPDPPSVGGGDQRMSATGFEETELSYNIADEDSKDDPSALSSGNETDDSSDVDSPGPPLICANKMLRDSALASVDAKHGMQQAVNATAVNTAKSANNAADHNVVQYHFQQAQPNVAQSAICKNEEAAVLIESKSSSASSSHFQPHKNFGSQLLHQKTAQTSAVASQNLTTSSVNSAAAVSAANGGVTALATNSLTNIPQEVILQLIQSGHLQIQTEEDGSGHQYVTIPLSSSTANLLKANSSLSAGVAATSTVSSSGDMAMPPTAAAMMSATGATTPAKDSHRNATAATAAAATASVIIKQELD